MLAKAFTDELSRIKTKGDFEKNQRFYRFEGDNKSDFLGVRMGSIFELAKKFTAMSLGEVEKLLSSKFYEARMGAVSIMDFQARNKKTSEDDRKKLFDLYIKQHKQINNWDLVDRSAPYVVGGYLNNKPRKILYKLAKSKNVWERRTAIVSTWFFIRQNDINDTFKIAELLVKDKHEMIHTAVGSWIREAGKRNKKILIDFLNRHSSKMPRQMLRLAVEKLSKAEKEVYMRK